jgi:hypothetical protein
MEKQVERQRKARVHDIVRQDL